LLRAASQLADLSLLIEPRGMPRLPPASSLPPPTVQVTTLANGLRVCTQETYGQVASLALFIDAGSMYESEADGTIGAVAAAPRRVAASAAATPSARRAPCARPRAPPPTSPLCRRLPLFRDASVWRQRISQRGRDERAGVCTGHCYVGRV
jgi:hypothetical protein